MFFYMSHIDYPNLLAKGGEFLEAGAFWLVLTASNDWLRVRTYKEEARIWFRFRLTFVCDG